MNVIEALDQLREVAPDASAEAFLASVYGSMWPSVKADAAAIGMDPEMYVRVLCNVMEK